jgi:hypothetical protein
MQYLSNGRWDIYYALVVFGYRDVVLKINERSYKIYRLEYEKVL